MEERPTKKMIQNIGERPLVDREDKAAPATGFGSVIPRHDKTHGQTFFQTSNQAFYGEKAAPTKDSLEEEMRRTAS